MCVEWPHNNQWTYKFVQNNGMRGSSKRSGHMRIGGSTGGINTRERLSPCKAWVWLTVDARGKVRAVHQSITDGIVFLNGLEMFFFKKALIAKMYANILGCPLIYQCGLLKLSLCVGNYETSSHLVSYCSKLLVMGLSSQLLVSSPIHAWCSFCKRW